jgi:hypothetical protein
VDQVVIVQDFQGLERQKGHDTRGESAVVDGNPNGRWRASDGLLHREVDDRVS